MELLLLIGIVVAIVVGVVIIVTATRGMRPKLPEPQTYTAPPVTARTAPARSNASPASGLDAQTIAEIDRLVAADHRIQAVKLYRERTGVGLKDAKDRIDHWSISTTAPHTAAVSHANPTHHSSMRTSLPASAATEIDRLLAAGQRLEAIKLLRAHTGLGLKESMQAIDAWRPGA